MRAFLLAFFLLSIQLAVLDAFSLCKMTRIRNLYKESAYLQHETHKQLSLPFGNRELFATSAPSSSAGNSSKQSPTKKLFIRFKNLLYTFWASTIGALIGFVSSLLKKKDGKIDMVGRTIDDIKAVAAKDVKEAATTTTAATVAASASSDLTIAKKQVVLKLAEIQSYETKKAKVKKGLEPTVVDSFTSSAIDHAQEVVHFALDEAEAESGGDGVVTANTYTEDSGAREGEREGEEEGLGVGKGAVAAQEKENAEVQGEADDKGSSWAKIKSAGKSGIIAYVFTELAFWIVLPVCVFVWQTATHQEIDIANSNDQAKILGLSAGVITIARTAVPARIALALSLVPFVDQYVNKEESAERSNSDDASSSTSE